MNKKAFFLAATGLLGLLVIFLARRARHSQVIPEPLSNPAAQSQAWDRVSKFQATNASLRELSTNNPEFQKWGKNFMLKIANDHLSKVPLFGLKKEPLNKDDILIASVLTPNGAEFDMATKDLKYSLYYDNGVLSKAVAVDAEMTGMFRDPSKYEKLGENVGVWSEEKAKQSAETLVQAKGMNLRELGAIRGPIVHPETFNLPTREGSTRPITAFYTVTWYGWDDMRILEVRFRHTATGNWEPTYWFDNSRQTSDRDSTSFTNLYKRFFAP